MPPIDYSKWDNIDTDSEHDEPQQSSRATQPPPGANPASSSSAPRPAPSSTGRDPQQQQSVPVSDAAPRPDLLSNVAALEQLSGQPDSPQKQQAIQALSDTIDAQMKAAMKAQQEYADQMAAASSSSAPNPASSSSAPRPAPSSTGGAPQQEQSAPADNTAPRPDLLSNVAALKQLREQPDSPEKQQAIQSLTDTIDAQIAAIRQAQQEAADQRAAASSSTGAAASTTSQSTSTTASSDLVQAVIVRCDMERTRGVQPWAKIMLPSNHAIFQPPIVIPDIPRLIDIPLIMHRVGTQSRRQADLDNQIITYININAESGFADAQWQSRVGTVLVARADKKPLLPHHLEGVWMYCDRILDYFGEGYGPPRRMYSRKAFEDWWGRYVEEQKGFRGGKGGEDDINDWRAVRSPYEM